MEVEYLNTDLEIQSADDLSLIVEEFCADVQVLFNGKAHKYNLATFEADYPFLGADEAVDHFCVLVENLSTEARNIWDNCVSRIFDLGYQSGDSANSYRTELREATIKRVAAIGASIVITVYPTGLNIFESNKSYATRRDNRTTHLIIFPQTLVVYSYTAEKQKINNYYFLCWKKLNTTGGVKSDGSDRRLEFATVLSWYEGRPEARGFYWARL